MKRMLPVVVLLMLSGCVNPFVKHDSGATGGAGPGNASSAVLPAGEPKLVKGADPDSEGLRMLEDGYGRLGFSYFTAASVDANHALEQARAVHADIVILYASKAGDRYDCLASYWVKLKPPVFGVHMQDLTAEIRKSSGTKTGASVIAVVKDSPAARAGIARGDIVSKIGDVEVGSAASLYDAVEKLAGQKVMVEVWRDHEALQKEVQLGQRP